MTLVHWLLKGGLLHMVQRGGDWVGLQPDQAPACWTKCDSPPVSGQCTNHRIAVRWYSTNFYNLFGQINNLFVHLARRQLFARPLWPSRPTSFNCLSPACRACDYVYTDCVRRSRSSSCRLLRPINCQTYITLHYSVLFCFTAEKKYSAQTAGLLHRSSFHLRCF